MEGVTYQGKEVIGVSMKKLKSGLAKEGCGIRVKARAMIVPNTPSSSKVLKDDSGSKGLCDKAGSSIGSSGGSGWERCLNRLVVEVEGGEDSSHGGTGPAAVSCTD